MGDPDVSALFYNGLLDYLGVERAAPGIYVGAVRFVV
jgi:hypothetical protein